MARDFSDRERDSVSRDRRIRQQLFERGHQPFGDKFINPRMKESAYDYYRWMNTSPSISVHAGAYLGNLEREEHVLGMNSYPPEHPRHAHVESGRYYPQGIEIPQSGRSSGGSKGFVSPVGELRQAATRALEDSPRTNTVSGTCARCGNEVPPGEGRIVRRSSGYVVLHHNEV